MDLVTSELTNSGSSRTRKYSILAVEACGVLSVGAIRPFAIARSVISRVVYPTVGGPQYLKSCLVVSQAFRRPSADRPGVRWGKRLSAGTVPRLQTLPLP